MAFNAEGKEVWRVVYEGHDKRVKVYPDGRPERFDGKRNRPPKALYETLKYRPSILDERVKYVRLIYRWYTTESITAGQIASRLNDLGVLPVFGPLWHQGVVKYLLANPVYVGRPTYNKQSNSRFMEFTGGQVKTAERKPSRKRAEADHIRPEKQEFKPMIDPDVFDKAQAKLAATKTRAHGPEDRRLMAQGVRGVWAVRQAHVGPVGQRPQLAGPRLHLLAISALGQTPPSGCGHFFVEHDLLESLVLDYLTQAAPQVKQLLDAATATNLDEARPLLDAIHDAKVGQNGVWLDMLGFVDTHFHGNKARRKTRMSVQELYGLLYERAKPELEKKVADKEAEIESVLDGFAGLTPKDEGSGQHSPGSPPGRARRPAGRPPGFPTLVGILHRPIGRPQGSLGPGHGHIESRGPGPAEGRSAQDGGGQDRLSLPPRRQACYPGSIEVIPAEDAAIRPLTFPAASLLKDSCLGVSTRNPLPNADHLDPAAREGLRLSRPVGRTRGSLP